MMIAVACMTLLPMFQDPGAGISRQLAEARARQVKDVHYRLQFELVPGSKEVTGSEWLSFVLPEGDAVAPVVLDFAGSGLTDVQINRREPDVPVAAQDGHLVLPSSMLTGGTNTFAAKFRSPVAPTGTPLTVYRDPADGREYWYTLVVPADAHRLYPCFDQPDLKAGFTLTLDVPAQWAVVANGIEQPDASTENGRRRIHFRETKPISTYLMAFAAGPFDVVDGGRLRVDGIDPTQPLRLFVRPSQRHNFDRDALVHMHAAGLRWLTEYFGVPYPFDKLDVVLVPGFPYSGMEHAGAIFYREQALVFDHPPTQSELLRRSTVVYHELSHQWFGNLVTMRWFDDLWLKEGFATFLGYRCLADLEPGQHAWLRFLQRIKLHAYEIDCTEGTTPVYQALDNLADAKSAYGPIVYNKAPAILRELHERLGAAAFRAGLKRFLDEHAFGNADWQDLAAALAASARTDLREWSDRWLLAPSMPQVRVGWRVDANGLVRQAELQQHAIFGTGSWPLRLDLLVYDLAGGSRRLQVATDAARCELEGLVGRAAPACVVVDPEAVSYGQFVPDPVSRAWLLAHTANVADPLLQAVMTSQLFESVREAELDPALFAGCTIDLLAATADAETHAWLLDLLGVCLDRYLVPQRAAPLRERATTLLLHQLATGPAGRELQTFRFLARESTAGDVLELCRRVARFGELPAGLVPGKRDRFLAAAALLAAGRANGELDLLQQHFRGEDIGKELFMARAASPDPVVKQEYWNSYLQLDSPPEQWTQDSLTFFHWPGQEELTLPFLQRALEQVDWVKEHRKIFFMPAWIDGFVNGHSSAAALAVVQQFLAGRTLPGDIRAKVLQSLDGLERAVRIRRAFQ
jgi:aminopeptidase N